MQIHVIIVLSSFQINTVLCDLPSSNHGLIRYRNTSNAAMPPNMQKPVNIVFPPSVLVLVV